MKGSGILNFAFLLIGIALLAVALYLYRNTSNFIDSARKAQGTVVALRSGAPEVKFRTEQGREIQFTSSVSSKPPSYSVGETVEVLYPPDQPDKAEVNSFMTLWLGVIIVGVLGTVFSLIGLALVFAFGRKPGGDPRLKLHGQAIQTDFQGVERDASYSVNGRNPFQVVTQWKNPNTGEIHLFHSDYLWYDPTSHIKTGKITVYTERGNPGKYFMDTSFLPKLAGNG
jgi:hypothetical protein